MKYAIHKEEYLRVLSKDYTAKEAKIVDKVTDTSNNHSVCHRMLHTSTPSILYIIKEAFFDFVQLEGTNSESVHV